MSFSRFVAIRYLISPKKQRFVSFITFVSIGGICIGVTALVVALSLINGFQTDIRDRLFQTSYHLMVMKNFSPRFGGGEELAGRIASVEGVVSATPVLFQSVLIRSATASTGGVVKGMPPKALAKEWKPFLVRGSFTAPTELPPLFLGKGVAETLGVIPGDKVKLLFPELRLSPFGALPRQKSFEVGGIIESGLYEFDSLSLLTDLSLLQKSLSQTGQSSFVGVKVKEIFNVESVQERLERELGDSYMIVSWKELNRPLFSALKLEKTVLFFTIALIVFVAALNIIATLILLVVEKVKEIGILSSLGATPTHIRRIFFFQGAFLGLAGTLAGIALGLLTVFIANTFQLIKVPYEIYHIRYLRLLPDPTDILIITLCSLAITFLTTLYPAHKAAGVDPAEALREE